MSVNLGMPPLPPPVLPPRRKTRQILLKHPTHPVAVGGDAPISVQSMATTLTADVNSTLQQIAELTASGCQVVRVAVPSQDDADALPDIAALVNTVSVPLFMATDVWGVLQRLMFLTAAAWYAREALQGSAAIGDFPHGAGRGPGIV